MSDCYEECRDPPRLYLLDRFDNAGVGTCLKRYSDPSYFKKSLDVMRADKTAHLQKERRSHKIKDSRLISGEITIVRKSRS